MLKNTHLPTVHFLAVLLSNKLHTQALSVVFWQMHFYYSAILSMKGFETLCDPDAGSVAEATELIRWLTCALFGWQLLLEDRVNTASLSQEVGVFVEMLWTEALGSLDRILAVSVDKLSLNDVRLPPHIVLRCVRLDLRRSLSSWISLELGLCSV